jgi:hypothetical protein
MRFMILVKATRDTEAGRFPPDTEQLFADMAAYHEALRKAGALLDGSGLQPSANGWRVKYAGGKRTFVDGPFPETKELVAGYTLIQVKSLQEAIAWTKRFPNPAGRNGKAEIEVRPLYELEDFEPVLGAKSDAIERFREMGIAGKK